MAVMNSAGKINFDKREEYVFSDEETIGVKILQQMKREL